MRQLAHRSFRRRREVCARHTTRSPSFSDNIPLYNPRRQRLVSLTVLLHSISLSTISRVFPCFPPVTKLPPVSFTSIAKPQLCGMCAPLNTAAPFLIVPISRIGAITASCSSPWYVLPAIDSDISAELAVCYFKARRCYCLGRCNRGMLRSSCTILKLDIHQDPIIAVQYRGQYRSSQIRSIPLLCVSGMVGLQVLQ